MQHTTLLIVDDVPQVRQELTTLLSLAGPIRVVGEAADGLEAISQAKALRPDAIVLDLEMPGGDGYTSCRELKQRGLAKTIVVLTIHASPAEKEAAIAAGADRFVAKGAGLAELLDAILRPIEGEENLWLPQ